MKNKAQSLYDFFVSPAPVAIMQFPVTAYVDTPLEDTNIDFLHVVASLAASEFEGFPYVMNALGYDDDGFHRFQHARDMMEIVFGVADESLRKNEFIPGARDLMKELPEALRFFQDYLERKHNYIAKMHEAELGCLKSMIGEDERREKGIEQRNPKIFKQGRLAYFRTRNYLEEERELTDSVEVMEQMAFNHAVMVHGIRKFNRSIVKALKGNRRSPIGIVPSSKHEMPLPARDWQKPDLTEEMARRSPVRHNRNRDKDILHLSLVKS